MSESLIFDSALTYISNFSKNIYQPDQLPRLGLADLTGAPAFHITYLMWFGEIN